MRTTAVLVLLTIMSSVFAQRIVTTIDGREVTPSYQPIVQSDGTMLPASHGVWRAHGYGYLIEITENELSIYNETSSLVWELEGLDEAELSFSAVADGKLALISPDEQTPPYFVERIDAFPDVTKPKKWTPKLLYAAFAETMGENYVFFKERDFDWASRKRKIEPQVNDELSDAQLFDLLAANLEGLEDAHVQLGATIDGEPRRPMFGMSATEKRGIEVFSNQTEFSDFEPFLNDRIQKFEAAIATTLLKGKAKQACDQFTWGIMEDNVGYLHIAGMSGFADSDSTEDQLRALHNAMNQVLRDLKDTRYLIIDISTNGGGSDEFSTAIASHFADKRRLAFVKGPKKNPRVRHSVFVEPYKSKDSTHYAKPIFLVINDITVSAAEIFVLSMKDIPNVTLVGRRTRGALSDVLPKTLPNGWAYGLSNEIYLDSKGKCYEVTGIPPKVEIEVIDPTKPDLGHWRAIQLISEIDL